MCRAHAVHIFHQCICHDSFEFHCAHKHTLYNTHMYHRFCQLMKLKFSKMTTDGAKRPKISMASLHLKKGKMWWSLSTGARQKDKDIDQVNWKQNALWMLPMHLQLLEVYNSNRFVHWHLHIVLWVLHRRIYGFCVLCSCIILSLVCSCWNLVMHYHCEKNLHTIFLGLPRDLL